MEPIGGAWIQFNIRYYMFALVFVIFDVETVFLYPWAVAFNRLGLLAFIEALIFIAILVIALAYACVCQSDNKYCNENQSLNKS